MACVVQGRQLRPRCQPPLPDADLLEHPALQHLVLDLASHLEVNENSTTLLMKLSPSKVGVNQPQCT